MPAVFDLIEIFMNYTEAKEIITGLLDKQEYTQAEKEQIESIHQIIYKTSVADCNCSNKYRDAVVKMAIWFRHNSEFSKCHYVIQRGEAFMVGLTYYNNSNLTDEIAEQLIATNERAKAVISKIEYDDQPADETPVQAKETASNDEQTTTTRKKSRRK